jgi:hypothetical protein
MASWHALHLTAAADCGRSSEWFPTADCRDGSCWILDAGAKGRLLVPPDCRGPRLLVLTLPTEQARYTIPIPKMEIDGVPLRVFANPGFPEYLLALIHTADASEGDSCPTLTLSLQQETGIAAHADGRPRRPSLLIESISIFPRRGILPTRWARPTRLLLSKLFPIRAKWDAVHFPYSHFDGLAYLRRHVGVKEALIEKRIDNAITHFARVGHREGKRAELATTRRPNSGWLIDLARWQDQELRRCIAMRLENEILRKTFATLKEKTDFSPLQ